MRACMQSMQNLRKTGEVIVLCPDRMTVQIENELFDILQVSSLFDVNVVTMSRLSSTFLEKKGVHKKILSKQLAVALIKKIVQENKLNSFEKVKDHNGFALKLFEMISMFKSSRITPDDLLSQSKNQLLNEKLSDLAIIYHAYESYLQNEYTDSFNKLDAFIYSVENEYKDVHMVFVGFDDFTKQAYSIIQMFLQKSKSVSISTTSSYKKDSLNNKNIYTNQIFYALIELSKKLGIVYDITDVEEKENSVHMHMIENLFSYTPIKFAKPDSAVKIVHFSNKNKELEFVLKNIQYKVVHNGTKYGDFAVAMPALNANKTTIFRMFQEAGIPCFIDASDNLMDSNICKFLFSIFETIKTNYNAVETLHLLQNYFSNVKKVEIENLTLKVNRLGLSYLQMENVKEYPTITQFLKNILPLNQTKNIQVGTYVQLIKSTFEQIQMQEKTNMMISALSEKKDIEGAKNYKIAYEKLMDAMGEMSAMFFDYECSLNNFVDMLKAYLENVTITLPPLVADSVMVYDINTSYLNTSKTLYVLSCVDKDVPQVTDDVSIICDKEIKYFSDELQLSPTVEFINNKNKFKVFENLLQFKNQLIVTYFDTEQGSKVLPSSVITSLFAMFDISQIDGDAYILDYGIENEFKQNAFLLNNITIKNAKTNYINLLKNYPFKYQNEEYIKAFSSLREALGNDAKKIEDNLSFKNEIPNLKTNLFFPHGTTSVSEIESYYRCPYQHFVSYGLRLKELKTWELQPNDIGNILHSYLDKVIEPLSSLDSDKKIKQIANDILHSVMKEEFSEALNPKNKHIMRNLFREAEKIAEEMYQQLRKSEFKNKWHEKVFKELKNLSVEYKGYKIFIKGKIDRVDEKDNMFSLIDYKTGQDTFKYKDIVIGKKLQLFVYVKAVNELSGQMPVLACYMPIKNNFSKDEKEKIKTYQWLGVFSNSIDILNQLDTTFLENGKSDFIKVKLKKDEDFDRFTKPYALSSEDMIAISKFAFEMVESAVAKIIDGDITPFPLYTSVAECSHCKYKSMCNFSKYYNNKYRNGTDVDISVHFNKEEK